MAQSALQAPTDVLGAVFSTLSPRDAGAVRLVCRHWKQSHDASVVRSLVVACPEHARLLQLFPLVKSVSLGLAITSHRSLLASLAQLASLQQLQRLSLHFASPAAVRLPSCLHALSRLRHLTIRCCPQGRLTHTVGRNPAGGGGGGGGGGDAGGEAGGSGLGGAIGPASAASAANAAPPEGLLPPLGAAQMARAGVAKGFAGRGGSGGGSSSSAAAIVRATPAGLTALLYALGSLTSLELIHVPVSVPEILAAVREAAASTAMADGRSSAAASAYGLSRLRGLRSAGGSSSNLTATASGSGKAAGNGAREHDCGGGGGLRRLVLMGSGVNLTGVNAPAAAAQLQQLELLTLDACTGADALVPLLPHLTQLRHLELSGMDYAWASTAGYHRLAGFGSANDLQRLYEHHEHGANGPGPNDQTVAAAAPFPSGPEGVAARLAAAAAAAAAGQPLGFLLCMEGLASLSLAGSFLRTLPSRAIGGLSGLTSLDLSGNGIDELPHGLSSLPLLVRLDVSTNQIAAMPAWFSGLQSLTSLSIHHNCLERFPVMLYDLSRLSYLAIGNNRITWWPVESLLFGLPYAPSSTPPPSSLALACLDLSHNHMLGLAGGLAGLGGPGGGGGGGSFGGAGSGGGGGGRGPLAGSLAALRLRDCLGGLDAAAAARAVGLLACLTGLRELDLASNRLGHHAIVALSELRQLRQLWLADNGLEELPLGLAQLSRLTLLSLRANLFTEVPVCLRGLSRLELLDLSCNRLQELPAWLGAVRAAAPAAPAAAGPDGAGACAGSCGCAGDGGGGGGGWIRSVGEWAAAAGLGQGESGRYADRPGGHYAAGLVALRHLDVSQQYSVAVRESGLPHVPPRLEVQPPHCLYGPLSGDLPDSLLRLPRLRSLVLQRHFLGAGSGVLRRLKARGVEVVHPRPLRPEWLPGTAAAAFNAAAAAGGVLFPDSHPALRAAAAAGHGRAHGADAGGGGWAGGGGGDVGALPLPALVAAAALPVLAVAAAVMWWWQWRPPPEATLIGAVLAAALLRVGLLAEATGRRSGRAARRRRVLGAQAGAAGPAAAGALG
ncbi:hypothetical protein HYH03_008601 [Edaphochlamys debaryana]|uniref:F-box domain-containing protein n=1 Tax=Edaphochlamys debaryana TaxID=47281 RepID=A0A836BXW0_9CHLO|nr:hypothetical protein HYH03_008601 [Edaphochlamys debaryana]|eukprot:KAG2493181.1 hypothetical protein HYH03_008601 [Edaphochlamys debaryana]